MARQRTLLPKQLGDTHIRLLRIFKAVVECGGFATAEIELNISRPAISVAISELEELLNIKLCFRGRGGFALTESGEQVHQATLTLLGNIENFRLHMNAIKTELSGEFNIGITDNMVTVPQMRVTEALKELKEKGSGIVINIKILPTDAIEAGVTDGHLHIGIVTSLRSLPALNYLPLYDETSLLYCGINHPLFNIKDSDIDEGELIKYDMVSHLYPQSKDMQQAQKGLKGAASSNSREGIAFLLLSGSYLGFLPTHYAQHWVAEHKLKAIHAKKRHFNTPYSAITRKGARPNLLLEAYLQLLNNN